MAGNKEVIAVDLGGTNLRVARVRGKKIFDYQKKSTPKEKNALIREIVDSVAGLMNKNTNGIGVASPGPLKDGIIKNPPNLPLRNFNLKKFLKKKFKVRVEVGNDADCVALSEAEFGCKKKNFLVITLGTGVGGGIIINGKLFSGTGYAGEVGNIVLDKGKDMEVLWQENRRICQKYFGEGTLVKDLFKIKDKKAKEILFRTTNYLGQGIASLINVLDPEVVVLMGGIRETGEKFLNLVRKEVKKYSALPKTTPIKWSKIAHPGILGASLLVR